jgi:hypothetical protein
MVLLFPPPLGRMQFFKNLCVVENKTQATRLSLRIKASHVVAIRRRYLGMCSYREQYATRFLDSSNLRLWVWVIPKNVG